MSGELKPCPFCAGKSVTHQDSDRGWYVFCEVCDTQQCQSPRTEAEAIAAWNTRAPATLQVAQPPEVRERVARTLYDCERLRSEHAASVLSAATGKAVPGMAMEPWEECKDAFLSDADAVLALGLRFAVPTPEMVAAGVEAGWPGECVYADEFDGPEAQVTAIYRAMAALIATSAVDGRETVERCASILDAVIAEGYRTPTNKVDTCEHGKYGWEDCIACYDEALTDAAARMRALSSGDT